MAQFEPAVRVVLEHEGGYVDNPSDPGGATAYGLSQRTYPDLDMRAITEEDAARVYLTDWWIPLRLAEIQDQRVATKVLDICINMGRVGGVRILQRALRASEQRHVAEDGRMGPQTLGACNAANPDMLLGALRAEARGHYERLIRENPDLRAFERGWLRRALA